jgi:hypothetical protein
VLGENDAALELFEHFAANEPAPRRRDGNLELLIELPREQPLAETLLGRALRVAATTGMTANPWRLLKQRVHETAEHIQPGADEDVQP